MRRNLLLIVLFLAVIGLLVRFAYNPLRSRLGLLPQSGVRVEANTQAKVLVDSQPIGSTPVEKDGLSVGEHLIEVKSSQGDWQGYVSLYPGTKTVVNRNLEPTIASSSGDVIALSQGQGVKLTSNPSGSQVEMDGSIIGQTPLTLSKINPGDHLFIFSHIGYLNHSVQAVAVKNYTLNLSVDLSLAPLDNSDVPTPPDLNAIHVKVLPTPTGFLRVRDQASLGGNEIEQVKPGDDLVLLDEETGWDHVKLPDGKMGYVSADYVEKVSNP